MGTPNARRPAPSAAFLPVADLKPHPRNPRMHGSEVTALARTILRTAWGAPIVAQARSLRVIAGHGRLLAAKLILAGLVVDGEIRGGAEHRFDPEAPPGHVPVRLVDVSDADADAMTLADNARAIQGTDDAALLVEMAAQFGRESAMLADVGFDAAELDALVKRAGDAVIHGTALGDDAFGALPDEPKPPYQHIAFTLTDAQHARVLAALAAAPQTEGSPSERRAAALTAVCEQSLE